MATGFEPAPGHDDLAAQAKAVEEAELAEALAEVRRRRAVTAETSDGEPVDGITPNDKLVAVIDPDGSEYEVDTETGAILLDDDGKPVPKWPHETVTIKGREIQIRAPKPSALQAFGLATTKGVPIDQQNRALGQIVRKHISARSFEELQDAMMDPDDPFEMEDFQELVKEIATRGTGRPTGPSKR